MIFLVYNLGNKIFDITYWEEVRAGILTWVSLVLFFTRFFTMPYGLGGIYEGFKVPSRNPVI